MGIGAIVGGALSLGGSLLSSSSQSKAATKAADTSLAVAEQNNALAREIYGKNSQTLAPFVNRGNAAGDQINALLGLGGAANTNTAAPQVNALYNGGYGTAAQYQGAGGNPTGVQPNALTGLPWNASTGRLGIAANLSSGYGDPQFWNDWMVAQQNGAAQPSPTTGATGTVTQGTPNVDPAQAANDAFDIFRNSTGYQFTFDEGQNALRSAASAGGWLQSGAALKEAQDRGQQTAFNTAFMPYMSLLSNQQGVGLASASAQAGVGNNYVSNVSANNNSAGSAIANAALVKGANNPFANALGTFGAGIFTGFKG